MFERSVAHLVSSRAAGQSSIGVSLRKVGRFLCFESFELGCPRGRASREAFLIAPVHGQLM